MKTGNGADALKAREYSMELWQMILIILLLAAILVLLIIVLMKSDSLGKNLDTDGLSDSLSHMDGQLDAQARSNAEFNSRLREEVTGNLRNGLKTQSDQLLSMSKLETEALSSMKDGMVRTLTDSIDRLQASNEQKLGKVEETVDRKLENIEKTVDARLDRIQGVVDEKLDKTLNERLDTNFKAVGDQLGKLYQSLGELQALSTGVSDLNKTLSNVKTRGTWGEVQLGRILEQTMTRSQYAENVATKKNSDDRVEYAVRFPSQDGTGESVYLPIDSKFPSDIYNRIVDASAAGDPQALAAAVGLLKGRILDEARTIRDKYLSPPRTTNYAIMFLPTEGLYAEVLRVDGLTEQCQALGVIVAGPTTVTAILNSLQSGFRNVMLSKKSVEVMKLLEAVKAQFAHMDEEVEKTQKQLSAAVSSTDKLAHRTKIIKSRMRNIGEMDISEAESILLPEETAETDEGVYAD